jgi:superoxide dismutase, Cu-Zn family
MLPRIVAIPLLICFPVALAYADTTPKAAHANIVNSQGAKIGSAKITSTTKGVKVAVTVSELTPGGHGIHIHTVGKCEGPAFTSSGGHFNPTSAHHGIHNAQNPNPHLGDLPNLVVGESGKGKASFFV